MLIFDAKFLNWLVKNGKKIMNRNKRSLIHAIYQSCKCKAEIVTLDEKSSVKLY